MGIFDAGSNNCSTAGKGFNDFLSVISIGLVAGPSDSDCETWKKSQNGNTTISEKVSYMEKIKEFLEKYKMEIGLFVVIVIIMKM